MSDSTYSSLRRTLGLGPSKQHQETEISETPIARPLRRDSVNSFMPTMVWWHANVSAHRHGTRMSVLVREFEIARSNAQASVGTTNNVHLILETSQEALGKLEAIDAERPTTIKLCTPNVEAALISALSDRSGLIEAEQAIRMSAMAGLNALLEGRMQYLQSLQDAFAELDRIKHVFEQATNTDAEKLEDPELIEMAQQAFSHAGKEQSDLSTWLDNWPQTAVVARVSPDAADLLAMLRQTIRELNLTVRECEIREMINMPGLKLNRYTAFRPS